MFYFSATNKLVRGETIKIFNYGDMRRDFTYIDDIVEGVVRVMKGAPERLVGEDGRSGKYVTISHDAGYETFYCHCSETLVTEGTVVRAGEAVAKVGATGWATGPHLHFEIRKNGTKLDPLQILERDA